MHHSVSPCRVFKALRVAMSRDASRGIAGVVACVVALSHSTSGVGCRACCAGDCSKAAEGRYAADAAVGACRAAVAVVRKPALLLALSCSERRLRCGAAALGPRDDVGAQTALACALHARLVVVAVGSRAVAQRIREIVQPIACGLSRIERLKRGVQAVSKRLTRVGWGAIGGVVKAVERGRADLIARAVPSPAARIVGSATARCVEQRGAVIGGVACLAFTLAFAFAFTFTFTFACRLWRLACRHACGDNKDDKTSNETNHDAPRRVEASVYVVSRGFSGPDRRATQRCVR
jgi:hypothetical protein